MQSEKAPEFKKDTVYRLKNSTHIDWKRFTTLLASRIISDTIKPLTSENRRNAFIVDDSIYERKGSKKQNCWQRSMTMPATVIPVVSVC